MTIDDEILGARMELLHATMERRGPSAEAGDRLAQETRDLTAKLAASAQAFDALVADVRRAAGETHEPPADVGALVARVAAARREGAEAMREQCAQAAARVASAWARCECRCACGSSLAGLAAAEACAAEIRALPIVEAP